MKNKVFLIWGILTLVVLAFSLSFSSQEAVYCWDGIDVDDVLLEELCGITREDYFSQDFNPDDCPEAEQAVRMVGGCETDWPAAFMFTAVLMMLYLMLSVLFFIVRRLVRMYKSA